MLDKAIRIGVGFALLCFAFVAQAQVAYSTRPDYIRLKTDDRDNLFTTWRTSYPDSNITGLSHLFPRNMMGNLGLPSPDYFLRYGTPDPGFRFFDPPMRMDRYADRDVEYYRSTGPYAALTGITGSKQLQAFKLLFTHTFREKLNFTLRLNRYNSLGFYKRQQTYTNTFFLSSNYEGRRWGYHLYILNNNNRNQESGGLTDTLLNDSTNLISKELLSVRLRGASRENRETKAMINPWFRLNDRPDSVAGTNHYLTLKSTLSFNMFRYRDAYARTDNFYSQFLIDTAGTSDSSHVRQLSNELSYAFITRNSGVSFSAGYRNEISNVWQEADSLIFNHLLVSSLVLRKSLGQKPAGNSTGRYLASAFNAAYVLAGGNEGNFKIEGKGEWNFHPEKRRALELKVLFEQRSPDYIYNNWNSTHFQWTNNRYEDQQRFQSCLSFALGNVFQAGLFYQSTTNLLYFDDLASPRQLRGTIVNTGLTFDFGKVIWKHLGLALSYTLQNTSAEQYQRLPQNSATAKIFYTGNLFHNNLQLQLGAQAQAYQSFLPYAYMPATQVFYLQDKVSTETYPFVDVYMNARIRPVSFFLKLENVLNGRVGTNYALVMGYYQSPLAFRFGLTWVFFD